MEVGVPRLQLQLLDEPVDLVDQKYWPDTLVPSLPQNGLGLWGQGNE